jgi:hypothetical protein
VEYKAHAENIHVEIDGNEVKLITTPSERENFVVDAFIDNKLVSDITIALLSETPQTPTIEVILNPQNNDNYGKTIHYGQIFKFRCQITNPVSGSDLQITQITENISKYADVTIHNSSINDNDVSIYFDGLNIDQASVPITFLATYDGVEQEVTVHLQNLDFSIVPFR